MQLIYIGGYGRSGSTLLEQLMTLHPGVAACGEVARAARRGFKRKRQCTCGRTALECSVWRHAKQPRKSHNLTHADLVMLLLDRLATGYVAMVDSSKTAWGTAMTPFKLRRRLGKDFHLIHIVRDPRAVCWSTMRAPTKRMWARHARMPRFFVTLLGWWAANLACETFRWRYPDQYVRIRYEDLVKSPTQTLRTAFETLPTASTSNSDVATDNRHQLYGNRTRYQSLSLADVSDDRAWLMEMPRLYRALALPLSWPLSKRYGYLAAPA